MVAWESRNQDGGYSEVFARRFSADGVGLATEFQVNSFTDDYKRYPSLATDADGDFVIAWQSQSQDGGNNGIFGRRFSSDGLGLTAEFQVNSFTLRKPALSRGGGRPLR